MNAKDLTNEELAAVIRTMKITGICPSRTEEEILEEAAERLEDINEKGVYYGKTKQLQGKI